METRKEKLKEGILKEALVFSNLKCNLPIKTNPIVFKSLFR
jgi:hypothetical protein